MKFTRKPIEVEGIIFTGKNAAEIYQFTNGLAVPGAGPIPPVMSIPNLLDPSKTKEPETIETLQFSGERGITVAYVGDYVVKLPSGEVYRDTAEAFEAEHDLIQDESHEDETLNY